MKCQQAENWMDLALDAGLGEDGRADAPGLPAGWRPMLDAHLAGCSRCRSQWEMLRAAEQALRIPQPVAAPNDLLLEFRRRVEAGPAAQPVLSTPTVRFRWPWLLPIGGLAAVGATAALVVALRAPLLPRTDKQEMTANRPAAAPAMVEAPDAEWQKALQPQPARNPASPPAENAPTGAPTAPASASSGGAQAKTPLSAMVPAQAQEMSKLPEMRAATPPPPTSAQKPGDTSLGAPLYSPQASASIPTLERPGAEPRSAGRSAHVPSPMTAQDFDVMTRGLDRKVRGTSESVRPGGGASSPDAANGAGEGASRWFGRGESAESQVREGSGLGAKNKMAQRRDRNMTLAEAKQSPQPGEPAISPVLLAALRKPVELGSEAGTLQQAVQQLAAATGTPVALDPAVQETDIVPPQKSGPFWVVLQSVAKQANLRVVPRADLLLLAPATPPVQAELARKRVNRSQFALQKRAADQYREEVAPSLADTVRKPAAAAPAGPAGPQGSPAPGAPSAPTDAPAAEERRSSFRMSFGVAIAEKPDRRVWRVSEWGSLPTRGFTPIEPVALKQNSEPTKPAARKRRATPSPALRPRRPQ